MKQLTCEVCGGNDLLKQEGVFVCQSCGCKYSADEVKKLMVQISEPVKVEGINNADEDLKRAETFVCLGLKEEAKNIYRELSIKYPADYRVWFGMWKNSFELSPNSIRLIPNENYYMYALKYANEEIKTTLMYEHDSWWNEYISLCNKNRLIPEYIGPKPGIMQSTASENENILKRLSNGEYSLIDMFETYRKNTDDKKLFTEGYIYRFIHQDGMLYFEEIEHKGVGYCGKKPFISNGKRRVYISEKGEVLSNQGRPITILNDKLVINDISQAGGIVNEYSMGGWKFQYNKRDENNIQSSGACYIASAVYGSYDCPQVWTLRRYRDYTLAETWHGRAFIKAYYAISPTLVKLFGNTNWFKSFWKNKLDRMVSNLKNKGFEDKPYDDRKW